MPRPTLHTEQRYLAGPALAGQTALAAARERNAEAARANGRLDISEGTAAIHPNTGIRKAHSVGCTQSMEHSSGMWYDGRELGSGTLEKVDFEPVESPCGTRPDGALFMCYYDGELYADSEACYSDEDDDEDVYGDDEDDDGTDEAATNDDDDDEDSASESPDEMLYMRYCSDSKRRPAVVEHELDMHKLSFEQHKRMSSPVDPHDLRGRLMLVQGKDSSS